MILIQTVSHKRGKGVKIMIEWNEFYRRHAPHFDNRANFETNSMSYYEYLGKIREILKGFFEEYDRFNKEMHDNFEQYKLDNNARIDRIMEDLKAEIKEYNIAAIESWLDVNMPNYIASVAKFVWFGLSGDYFVAVIPDSLSNVKFDSTVDGHLVVMN